MGISGGGGMEALRWLGKSGVGMGQLNSPH